MDAYTHKIRTLRTVIKLPADALSAKAPLALATVLYENGAESRIFKELHARRAGGGTLPCGGNLSTASLLFCLTAKQASRLVRGQDELDRKALSCAAGRLKFSSRKTCKPVGVRRTEKLDAGASLGRPSAPCFPCGKTC